MGKKVKAAVMVGPGKIETQEFPYPEIEEGGMLMKMEMSGICGTDKHAHEGKLILYAGTEAETSIKYPYIPGHENVGIVAEISKSARKNLEWDGRELKEGDRVTMCCDMVCGKCWYCRNIQAYPWCKEVKTYGLSFLSTEPPHLMGGWAEYMYIKPGTGVYKVPDGIPPEVAGFNEIMSVTFALDQAKQLTTTSTSSFLSGNTVVIQGVGPLGMCFLMKSRMLGAGNIIAIDRSNFRLTLAQEFTADYTIDVTKTTSEERVQFVRDLTQGRGADVVIHSAGVPAVIPEGLDMLRTGGVYIEPSAFVDIGEVTLNIHRHITAKNVRLLGVTNHPITGYPGALLQFEKFSRLIPFEKYVTHRFPIEKADEAMRTSMGLESMKVVISPDA